MKMKLALTGEELDLIPVSYEKYIKFKDQSGRFWDWDQLRPLSTPTPSIENSMVQEVAHKINIQINGIIK